MKLFQKTGLMLIFSMFITLGVFGQDCNFYIPLEVEAGMEYQNYDRRDRLQGTQRVTVLAVNESGGEVTATLHAKSLDDRDRLLHEGEYDVVCKGDELLLDIQSLVDQNMVEGFGEMDLRIEGSELVIPSNLSVGQTLPDAEMTMVVENNGMSFATVTLNITNRKVEGREEITVPAGTFEVYKVSYETHTETRAMGVPIRVNTRTVEYYSPEVGMVRSEHFNRRDRLQGYTVLSKID
jgi:hypothetical protein